jgi:hypothetical protein
MGATAWRLGWWAPVAPALAPDAIIDPRVHGPLLAALADGAPLDGIGQARLDGLVSYGLVTPARPRTDATTRVPLRPRFPVIGADAAVPVRELTGRLGVEMARLLAGEWSRLEVEYEPFRAIAHRLAPAAGAGAEPAASGPAAAFLVVGGLLLDLGVRRQLRRLGICAPPFGGAFVWLVEGSDDAAGSWFARTTPLPGRGSLIRFGRPAAPGWDVAAMEPEAAPALPAKREPGLTATVEALGHPVARLVAGWVPELEAAAPPGTAPDGAYLAWAYSLALDAALAALAGRGLIALPPGDVLAVRAADPVLAAS